MSYQTIGQYFGKIIGIELYVSFIFLWSTFFVCFFNISDQMLNEHSCDKPLIQ